MFLIMKGQFAIILQIILGISVLLLGRRLFWLFVGVVGFIAGALLAESFFRGNSGLLVFIFAVVSGVLGALVAVLLQRLSIAVSGFLAGGYVSVVILHHRGLGTDVHSWIPFLVGGVVGALLLSIIFDPALIVLSSLIGAVLIVQPLHVSPPHTGLIFVLVAAAGMVTQTAMLKRSPRRSK
jgi:Domain of unknown function (DUF4203)